MIPTELLPPLALSDILCAVCEICVERLLSAFFRFSTSVVMDSAVCVILDDKAESSLFLFSTSVVMDSAVCVILDDKAESSLFLFSTSVVMDSAVCVILEDISLSAFCLLITSVCICSAVCSKREVVLLSKSEISDNVLSAVRSNLFVRPAKFDSVSLILFIFAECVSVPFETMLSRLH